MNQHQRREAKAARRKARITGSTRGNVRGPVTRATARIALLSKGEGKLLAIGTHIRTWLDLHGTQPVRKREKRAA